MDVMLYICNPCVQEAEEGGPRVSWTTISKNNKQTKQVYACYYFPQSCILGSEERCRAEVSGYANDGRDLMGANM